jgi:hypothetical protein
MSNLVRIFLEQPVDPTLLFQRLDEIHELPALRIGQFVEGRHGRAVQSRGENTKNVPIALASLEVLQGEIGRPDGNVPIVNLLVGLYTIALPGFAMTLYAVLVDK